MAVTVRADPAKAGQVRARFAAHRAGVLSGRLFVCSRPLWPHPRAHPSRQASLRSASCRASRAQPRSRQSAARTCALVARKAASGSTSRCRARLTSANIRSPISPAAARWSPASSAASISSVSSRILASTASGRSSRSRPWPAFCCSLSARVSAGSAGRNAGEGARSSSAPRRSSPLGLFLRLDPLPQALDLVRRADARASPNTCGCRRISFSVIAWTTSPKSKRRCSCAIRAWNTTCSRRSPSSSLQVVEIVARDRVGDLVGFLDACRARSSRNSAPGPRGSRSPASAAPP